MKDGYLIAGSVWQCVLPHLVTYPINRPYLSHINEGAGRITRKNQWLLLLNFRENIVD